MALTPTTDIPLGFEAPDFQLPNAVDGIPVQGRPLMEGHPSVVVFMCNHCPFVVHILDKLTSVAFTMVSAASSSSPSRATT